MGAVTVLGVACLVGVAFASSPLVIACTGAGGFFLIGLAGATAYWATCVRSRNIVRFATLIGGSHALGVLAQISLLEFTSNHLIEVVVLSAGIIALGAINARIWPSKKALSDLSAWQEGHRGDHITSSKFAGWRLDHMTPRTAVITIFALVLLLSVLFNTLYTFIDIGSPWTSQYTNVTLRILMAVGGLAGGVLFDLHWARYLGIVMFWMMLLSVGAMLGVEAGGPYAIGEVVYFLGSGVFMTFYTAVFIWIAQFLRAPDPVVQHGAGAQQRDRHRNRRTRAAGDRFDESRGSGRAADPPNHRHQRAALRRRHAGLASAPEGGARGRRAHRAARRRFRFRRQYHACQAAVGECTPAASNTTPCSDGSDTSVQRAADGMPEAAEGPTPGAAPSADDAAIDPEVHLADFAGRFSLTPREIEVLATVTADERPLKHVAADMGISLRVLQRHLTSLYQKTGTQSRVGLTKLFWE